MVRVNFADRLRPDEADRASVITNSIRTVGYVQPENLRGARYERFKGAKGAVE